MRKPYEAVRIVPISANFGTGLNLAGGMGTTAHGGAVDVTNGIGDFSVLVGGQMDCTASAGAVANSGTAVRAIQFSVYEATAATHAGSAIAGATLTLGAATAGTLRGLYDAFLVVTSALTTSMNLTINGLTYHTTALHAGAGTAAAIEVANHINGVTTHDPRKLPHYKAEISTAGVFCGATAQVYIHPDDDQATGLTIQMGAVSDLAIPCIKHLQGIINVNAHALSTNTPKWLNVVQSTMSGGTGAFYSFLLRPSGRHTPGAILDLNT